MQVILLTEEQANLISIGRIKAVPNFLPENTYRIQIEAKDHVESILGINITDMIVNISEITEVEPLTKD